MKEINSKLKIHINSVNIMNNSFENVALKYIFYSFGILAIVYVFVLGNMVSNIVARKGLEADARALSNEVNDLELAYLSMSNNVDLPLSYSLGFKETKTNFATRKSLGFLSNDTINSPQNDL